MTNGFPCCWYEIFLKKDSIEACQRLNASAVVESSNVKNFMKSVYFRGKTKQLYGDIPPLSTLIAISSSAGVSNERGMASIGLVSSITILSRRLMNANFSRVRNDDGNPQ